MTRRGWNIIHGVLLHKGEEEVNTQLAELTWTQYGREFAHCIDHSSPIKVLFLYSDAGHYCASQRMTEESLR